MDAPQLLSTDLDPVSRPRTLAKASWCGLLLGLLAILAGTAYTQFASIRGYIELREGQPLEELTRTDRDIVTAAWVGKPQEAPYQFLFTGGAADWPAARSLSLGAIDGVSATAVRYLREAKPVVRWVPDSARREGPAVKLRITGADGGTVAEEWLADQEHGDALLLGPLKLRLERAVSDKMLDDFRSPPQVDPAGNGLLVAYAAGQQAIERIDVAAAMGKTVPLGETGLRVELVKYLPNAVPDRMGTFRSKSDIAKNPMLELLVHVPGEPKPRRQIAFAKEPFLTLDGVYGRVCPVKFRYFHAAIQPHSALELLQTSDEVLHGRVIVNGEAVQHDPVSVGAKIKLPGGFEMTLIEHLPAAHQQIDFESVTADSAQNEPSLAGRVAYQPEPAALVRISTQGSDREVWLRRNDLIHGRQIVQLAGGEMTLQYESVREPLGAKLELLEKQRLRVSFPGTTAPQEYDLATGHALRIGPYTLAVGEFGDAGHGKRQARLEVSDTPGRFWQYLGTFGFLGGCVGLLVNRLVTKRSGSRQTSDVGSLATSATRLHLSSGLAGR